MTEVNKLVKWCKACEENTERVGKSKRCKVCRDRLNVANRAKAKAAAEADPEVMEKQRAAATERNRRYREREKAKMASMNQWEKFHYQCEKAAAWRARKEAQLS